MRSSRPLTSPKAPSAYVPGSFFLFPTGPSRLREYGRTTALTQYLSTTKMQSARCLQRRSRAERVSVFGWPLA